jgi:hypothetical protein
MCRRSTGSARSKPRRRSLFPTATFELIAFNDRCKNVAGIAALIAKPRALAVAAEPQWLRSGAAPAARVLTFGLALGFGHPLRQRFARVFEDAGSTSSAISLSLLATPTTATAGSPASVVASGIS